MNKKWDIHEMPSMIRLDFAPLMIKAIPLRFPRRDRSSTHRWIRHATLTLLIAAAVAPRVLAEEPADPAIDLANKLLGQLTLEEKVSLCRGDGTMSLNAIPKIGLNERFWMSDGPNNVRPDLADSDFSHLKPDSDPSEQSTALPRLSVLAMTWDRNLARQYGRALGEEARARGKDMMLGPGVNIVRTPLCGRNLEYLSEDPFLAAQIAVPEIEGIQSCDVAACVKHFALNNQELDRGTVDVEVDDRTLHEIYLPAFEAAVKEAHVLAVMGAYNQFRGEFCCQNDLLLNQILKKSWGFPGPVFSDWGATHDTMKAALGGLDVEMNAGNAIQYFKDPLLQAVKDGQVPMAVLDDKVKRVLYLLIKIHKLDGQPRTPGSLNTPEHQAFARQVAEDGIVLLKNEDQLLPLDKTKIKSILLIGRNAIDDTTRGGNSAAGNPPYEVNPLAGLQNLLGTATRIEVEPLGSVFSTVDTAYPERKSKQPAEKSAGWSVEYYNSADLSGPVVKKTGMRSQFGWKRDRPEDVADDYSARISATVPVKKAGEFKFRLGHDGGVRIRVNGQVIADDWADGVYRQTAGAFTASGTDPLQIAVEYRHKADQLSTLNLSWHTPTSAPEPDLAALAERAKTFDCVLFFTGDHLDRSESGEGEGHDRPGIDQPAGTTEAVTAILAANPHTIVINQSGAPVAMPWVDQAHTLVQHSFSGMENGNALARVLFGLVDPSGKLTVTFPKSLGDSPAHALGNYNGQKVTYAEGVLVGYRWFDAKQIEPLFPFGYGLSYTTFAISNLKLSTPAIHAGDSVTATADVANTGNREGAEVVQLYVGDPSATVSRPPHELKGFEKVVLKPGEKKTVSFTLHSRDFSYWDEKTAGWKADPGAFSILVGDSSRHLPLQETVTLTP
jgi:beta-glucosidase